jgi:hypothetical protein
MKPLNINPPTKPLRPIHPQTLHSLLSLAAENRPEKIPAAISRAVSNITHAEICFITPFLTMMGILQFLKDSTWQLRR